MALLRRQQRARQKDSHLSPHLLLPTVTLLLEENKSFFSLSASSPEAFRASFRFSYSLCRGGGGAGKETSEWGTLLVRPHHSTTHRAQAVPSASSQASSDT